MTTTAQVPTATVRRSHVDALSDGGASGVRRAYSDAKRARLTAVKDAYDPENVFHLNHNIAPSRRCGPIPAGVVSPPGRLSSGSN